MSSSAGIGLTNPFPGLRPFREEEEYLFFGREGQVDRMVDKLAAKRFLAVVGTSGSGKSSLVNCGLRPALRRGVMAKAGSAWRMAQFRPGADPIQALARSLAQPGVLFSGPDIGEAAPEGMLDGRLEGMIEATLGMGNLGVVDLFEQAQLADRANLLLIVDQFEELFRYTAPQFSVPGTEEHPIPEASVAFVNLLLEAAKSQYPIYVVLTMRSDFLGDCARFPGLPEAVNEGQFLVPRLTREERRAAVSGPIAVGGAEISPVLLTRLVNDVGDNPDQLSILQHALNRTWVEWQRERHGNEPISLAHYEAIGSMAHALDRHAERAFAELTTERQRRICEVVFQALTEKASDARGIRRPTEFRALCAIADASPAEVGAVLDVFRKPSRSFLMPPVPETVGPGTIIDISHESLMRVWNRLKEWVEREAESAAQYRRLVQSALLQAKGSAGWMTDPELAFMLEWQQTWQPTAAWAERYHSSWPQAIEFLERSRKQRDRLVAEQEAARKRKLRQTQWVAGVLGVLAAIALCLAYEAWRERDLAKANLQSAKEAVEASLSSAGSQQAREAADLPEMERFREGLLGKAESFYARIAQQNSNNEGLRFDAAEAHSRLGDINRLLEKPGKAIPEYDQAISDFESLARDYPGRTEYRQALAYAHNWLGETLRIGLEQGPLPPFSRSDAEKQYDEALRLQQQIHDQKPANSIYQQELARTYYNRGILRYDNGDLNSAESDFRRAVGLLEPLAETNAETPAGNPPPSQELARVYNNLATVLDLEERMPEAAQFAQRSIGIQEGLCRKEPDNREYKIDLAQFYFTMAVVLDENRMDLAVQRSQQALALFEELARPAPSLGKELAAAQKLHDYLLANGGQKKR
jgi:tetratricopeptide (TPR) repeat protein/energy-coupling factor transporter ATP-binding protein EcfA2